jgi:DNA replication protein DnaC
VTPTPQARLLTGAFGVGKSALAADIAHVLETSGAPYAAVDSTG